jgi:hypothetical protein
MGIVAVMRLRRPQLPGASWRVALRPVLVMARLDVGLAITTLTPYAVVAAAAALTGVVLQNHLHRIREDGLLVLSDPFAIPLYGGVLLLSIFSAISAATATARDREHGAVELLCYGPVSPFSYLLAKCCSHAMQYALMLLLLLGTHVLFALVTGLHIRIVTLVAAALSVGPAVAATTLGLLLAASLGRVRPTVLAVLGSALAAVGLQVAREILARVPAPEFHVNPVAVLRWAAFLVSSVTQWVLPFGYVDRALSATLRDDVPAAVLTAGAATLYAAGALVLAAASLRHTEVRR